MDDEALLADVYGDLDEFNEGEELRKVTTRANRQPQPDRSQMLTNRFSEFIGEKTLGRTARTSQCGRPQMRRDARRQKASVRRGQSVACEFGQPAVDGPQRDPTQGQRNCHVA